MEKAFEIQRQARDNVNTLQTYMTDLQNWEVEMKRKEAALNGDLEQDLPPVRSKLRKDKPVRVQKDREKRIKASDYSAWEKFDVEKACEDLDTAEMGPVSLDSKKSQQVKMEKLKEEAQYEKERGNAFVKQERWDEAAACYSRAIALVPADAVYHANRGLCHLKRERLHQAEADCSEALRLDPGYVKALQRRAAARERLGSLRAASRDLAAVLQLEPRNAAARRALADVRARMGTKGAKSKSSPTSPTGDSPPPLSRSEPRPAPGGALPGPGPADGAAGEPGLARWRGGADEPVMVIEPVKKPPHLRSKRALKHVPIQEILLGRTVVERPAEGRGGGDTAEDARAGAEAAGLVPSALPEASSLLPPAPPEPASLVPPATSVQFLREWRRLGADSAARSDYLSIIDPSRLASIFSNTLESEVVSGVLRTLLEQRARLGARRAAAWLQQLRRVRRFPALAMFLSDADRECVRGLLRHCRDDGALDEAGAAELRAAYEL